MHSSWLIKLFHLGSKRDLELNDLYRVPSADHSQSLGVSLEEAWKAQILQSEKKNETRSVENRVKPSLSKALIHVFGFEYAFLGIFAFVDECVIK
jgi:hypothetical protein